ncbi:hypothetical protein N7527_009322 [Penicillium freii]|nr:hypothetical protein N7527_009322 [Penicillium freii]
MAIFTYKRIPQVSRQHWDGGMSCTGLTTCDLSAMRGQIQIVNVLCSFSPGLRPNKVNIWLEPIGLWPETGERQSGGIAHQSRQTQEENEENRG